MAGLGVNSRGLCICDVHLALADIIAAGVGVLLGCLQNSGASQTCFWSCLTQWQTFFEVL